MIRFRERLGVVLPVVGLLAFSGCGGADASKLPTYPVTGIVRLDGDPFGPCIVEMISQDKGGRTVTGLSDANGKITFGTYEVSDGAAAGSYKVIIRSSISAPPPKPIPTRYGADRTSGLTATIKDSGANEVAFDLDSKGKTDAGGDKFNAAAQSSAFGAGASPGN